MELLSLLSLEAMAGTQPLAYVAEILLLYNKVIQVKLHSASIPLNMNLEITEAT